MVDQYIGQYGTRLYGLCLSLCANAFEADDLYQDTWLQVVKNISRYDPSREFEPWLNCPQPPAAFSDQRRKGCVSAIRSRTGAPRLQPALRSHRQIARETPPDGHPVLFRRYGHRSHRPTAGHTRRYRKIPPEQSQETIKGGSLP